MVINWQDTRFSGDLFERVCGVLLGLENPGAVRVRPSQGDGGVDIYAPASDGQFVVYQCKYFPRKIQWAQVAKSLDRLEGGSFVKPESVQQWYLVVPLQPTTHQKRTFDDKTKGRSFPCGWFAEDRLDALAARYPEVDEYYFGDGRERLVRLAADYASVFERLGDQQPVPIDEVRQRAEQIAEALGRDDPHLRRGFSYSPPGVAATFPPEALLVEGLESASGTFQVWTFERYRGAALHAADRLQLGLSASEDAQATLDDMLRYGGEPRTFSGRDLSIDRLPAAAMMEVPSEHAQIRVVPAHSHGVAEMRLFLTNDLGEAEVTFTRRSVSPGTDGASSVWHSPAGLVECRARFDAASVSASFRIEWLRDPSQATLAELKKELPLLKMLRAGTQVSIAPAIGPRSGASMTLDADLVDPTEVALYQALVRFQDRTTTPISVPDYLAAEDLFAVLSTGVLLGGGITVEEIASPTFEVELPRTVIDLGDNWTYTTLGTAGQLFLADQSLDLSEALVIAKNVRSVEVLAAQEVDDEIVRVTVKPTPYKTVSSQLVEIAIDEANAGQVPDGILARAIDAVSPTTFDQLLSELLKP